MSLVDLREQSASTLRFFAPATDDEISGVVSRFPGFKLAAYTSVLAQSNGVGELFCEGQHSFIHNMLLFSAVDALDWSARAFADRFLVIGAPGVDGVFFGPADLSASMGHRGNPGHPEVQKVIEEGIATVRAAGKAAGILTVDTALARRYLGLGALFVAVGVDTTLLARASRELAATFKGGAATAGKSGSAY